MVWPIPIDTSKQNLKSSRQLQQIKKHYLSNESQHPVIILAIHLCGTLSLKAIELFNSNPKSVKFLALKPCCLPGMIHAKRDEVFQIGNHKFDASEVCVHGKWKKNKWEKGPPRSHLEPKFKRWSKHLYRGIDDDHNNTNNIGNDNGDRMPYTSQDKDSTKNNDGGDDAIDDGNDGDGDDGATNKQKKEETSSESAAAKSAPVSASTIDNDNDHDNKVRKLHARIRVQHDGGFQNDFLFAERVPVSSEEVWLELEKHRV